MKISLEKPIRNRVVMDPDGWIVTCFAASGFIKGVSRVRFRADDPAISSAFSVSAAEEKADGTDSTARHALVYISEESGQEKISIVERFQSEEDALAAWKLVRRVIEQGLSARRVKRAVKTAWLYVVGPLVAFIVAMSVVRFLDSHNGSIASLNAIMTEAAQLQGKTDVAQANYNDVVQSLSPRAQASNAFPMPDVTVGVPSVVTPVTGSNTIHLGLTNQPPEKTLYIYADPNCPACIRFEPHMEDLAKDFSIEVIPVAFKPGSLAVAAQILCSKDPRSQWVSAMKSGPVESLNIPDCAEGYNSIARNMQLYGALKFKVTPMVVSGTGHVFSEGATAKLIRQELAAK